MVLAIAFFCFYLLITTIHASDSCSPSLSSDDSELAIVHIYGKCVPFSPPQQGSWFDTVISMAKMDPDRVSYLSKLPEKESGVQTASDPNVFTGNYVVPAKVGTPGQVMFMVMDTTRDATILPCSGCIGCSSSKVFSPKMSSTFRSMDCNMYQCVWPFPNAQRPYCHGSGPRHSCVFNQSYHGDSSFSATLSQDSLTLGKDILPNYTFGCINAVSGNNIPPQGLLGLSFGAMSLVSQFINVFSYCLPSFKSNSSIGSLKLYKVNPYGYQTIPTTPLLDITPRISLYYYVNLTGISVGNVLVPISPAFDMKTSAGTIIDTNTVISHFVQPIYKAIRDTFRKQIGKSISSYSLFDTCFTSNNESFVPVITMHFSGFDLIIPKENTLIHIKYGSSLTCLAMAAAPSHNENSNLNVIGSYQQQNFRIVIDYIYREMGIVPELCN